MPPGYPGAFAKQAPANASSGTSTGVTLSWGASSGASIYVYCFDTVNNNQCDTSMTITNTTSARISGLVAGKTYYWQVQVQNAAGTTNADDGTWWSFTVTK